MKKIAIFASGTGSNAKKIIDYFEPKGTIQVGLIASNKATAPVLDMAAGYGVPTLVIDRSGFYESEDLLQKLHDYQIDFIVLAGFLWLLPTYLVNAYEGRIINIHPALLPKYGGKGMYGMNVHRAVHEARDTESGISIHYVNPRYDEGQLIFQATCGIAPDDQPEDIARKVQQLEHTYFPKIIEQLLAKDE